METEMIEPLNTRKQFNLRASELAEEIRTIKVKLNEVIEAVNEMIEASNLEEDIEDEDDEGAKVLIQPSQLALGAKKKKDL